MRKILLVFLVVLNLSAFEAKNKLVISVPKQESEVLKIPAMDLKVGESGIATRESDKNEFVLGNVTVLSVENGIANVEISPFTSIKQPYMPFPLGEVEQKDKIIFRILYNRALAIAPNQYTFQTIVAQNESIDFIHPDIFATFLAREGDEMPDSNNIRAFCDRFNVGLVFIADKNVINILDCKSLVVIGKDAYSSQDSSAQSPFWTRLSDEAKDEMFDIDEFEEYFEYYKNFVGESDVEVNPEKVVKQKLQYRKRETQ